MGVNGRWLVVPGRSAGLCARARFVSALRVFGLAPRAALVFSCDGLKFLRTRSRSHRTTIVVAEYTGVGVLGGRGRHRGCNRCVKPSIPISTHQGAVCKLTQ
eukprot:5427731-Pleurochrysis_carterae.AAC.5